MSLILQEQRKSLSCIIKITEHVTLSTKTQRVNSVIADVKLKKVSPPRMCEINRLVSLIKKHQKIMENKRNTNLRIKNHIRGLSPHEINFLKKLLRPNLLENNGKN